MKKDDSANKSIIQARLFSFKFLDLYNKQVSYFKNNQQFLPFQRKAPR